MWILTHLHVFVFIRRNEELSITMALYLRPGQYDIVCYDVESNVAPDMHKPPRVHLALIT